MEAAFLNGATVVDSWAASSDMYGGGKMLKNASRGSERHSLNDAQEESARSDVVWCSVYRLYHHQRVVFRLLRYDATTTHSSISAHRQHLKNLGLQMKTWSEWQWFAISIQLNSILGAENDAQRRKNAMGCGVCVVCVVASIVAATIAGYEYGLSGHSVIAHLSAAVGNARTKRRLLMATLCASCSRWWRNWACKIATFIANFASGAVFPFLRWKVHYANIKYFLNRIFEKQISF